MTYSLTFLVAVALVLASVDGLSPVVEQRRSFLARCTAAVTTSGAAVLALPPIAHARYVLNDETGDYDEVEDEDWQTAWGKRLDKAKSMSSDEVFMAAQGAGNRNLMDGEESEASKKRRALAGCRNDAIRQKSGAGDAKACTSRVLGGEFQFIIDAM
mmetsp:Transcript_22716/g.65481  ORF Transcript_22716/g.65481 Transcript_22716/m.65481 type:complete len:157 (+) Transcript_22716:71-541(+)